MQGKHGHLSREQKQLALRLHARGWRLVDIAKEIGCSAPMVGIMARTGRHLDAKPFGWKPRPGQLTIDERELIDRASGPDIDGRESDPRARTEASRRCSHHVDILHHLGGFESAPGPFPLASGTTSRGGPIGGLPRSEEQGEFPCESRSN